MSAEVILEFLVLEVLLTQQYTTTSGRGEEIDEDFFVLGLCLSESVVETSLEPVLSRGSRDQCYKDRQSNELFLHGYDSL